MFNEEESTFCTFVRPQEDTQCAFVINTEWKQLARKLQDTLKKDLQLFLQMEKSPHKTLLFEISCKLINKQD